MIWQTILQNSFLVKKYPSTHTQKNVREINNEFSNSKLFSLYKSNSFFFLYPLLSCNIQMLALMVKLKVYSPKFFGKYKNSHPHIRPKGSIEYY